MLVFIRKPTPQQNVMQSRSLIWNFGKAVQKLPTPHRQLLFWGRPQFPPKKEVLPRSMGLELILILTFQALPGIFTRHPH